MSRSTITSVREPYEGDRIALKGVISRGNRSHRNYYVGDESSILLWRVYNAREIYSIAYILPPSSLDQRKISTRFSSFPTAISNLSVMDVFPFAYTPIEYGRFGVSNPVSDYGGPRSLTIDRPIDLKLSFQFSLSYYYVRRNVTLTLSDFSLLFFSFFFFLSPSPSPFFSFLIYRRKISIS